ncbi:MAG TPA: M23 family metallopeptidase [Bacteroidota bacterium]|nr:M23 family metallopeptidase [Bacteroidota bacterium]
MRKNHKLFFYSEESVSFVEAKGFKIKFALKIAGSILAGVMCLGALNHVCGDVIGVEGRNVSGFMTENRMLKAEVRNLNSKLVALGTTMEKLIERDNTLRTAVDLPAIDVDVQKLGTGGAKELSYTGIVSGDASEMIASSQHLMAKLEKEIAYQRQSAEEIYKKSESNKQRFASMPAIKPMSGEFTYHGFGYRRDPLLGVQRMHEGVDIQNNVGTPVYATGDGTIVFAGPTGSAYGSAVEVNHGFGYSTWYAHLLRPVVHAGEKVKRGTLIAYSGNSGRSTGPHLHYEVRLNGESKNPVEFFVDDVDYNKIRAQLGLLKR